MKTIINTVRIPLFIPLMVLEWSEFYDIVWYYCIYRRVTGPARRSTKGFWTEQKVRN